MSERRDFLKKIGLLSVGGFLISTFSENNFLGAKTIKSFFLGAENPKYSLPPLPYSYDALEPHIDKATMEIHHTKHHQAYVNNLNKALESTPPKHFTIEDLCKNISQYSTPIRNNAGGHFNHSFFWKLMKNSDKAETPKGKLLKAINLSFGSYEEFQKKFSDAAKNRFGSGWAWLVANNGKLEIGSTPNQDNPLMDVSEFKGIPILGIDVWEHAYYLKYQNKRGDYVSAWWNVINWNEVGANYKRALKEK